jgi:hypothetical protein
MSDLVKFRIPAAFVLGRLLPTPAEVVYGYERGWISEADVVAIALELYSKGDAPPSVEGLALLLSDELSRVPVLIEELRGFSTEADDAARAWLFLAMAWVHDNEADFLDPYEVVEMLYADFGYPPAVKSFVRFMPPSPGEPFGMSALDERWRVYLETEAALYRARRIGGAGCG